MRLSHEKHFQLQCFHNIPMQPNWIKGDYIDWYPIIKWVWVSNSTFCNKPLLLDTLKPCHQTGNPIAWTNDAMANILLSSVTRPDCITVDPQVFGCLITVRPRERHGVLSHSTDCVTACSSQQQRKYQRYPINGSLLFESTGEESVSKPWYHHVNLFVLSVAQYFVSTSVLSRTVKQ